MTQQTSAETSPLLPQRAFVVQFRAQADLEQGPCVGRVEHVTSGQATTFTSFAELEAFMTTVLADMRE